MSKLTVTEKVLHQVVREALFNTGFSGWSSNSSGPTAVNPNVDPSISVTDPVNPDFTPQDKTEFSIAVNQLVKNLPDTDMTKLYDAIKATIEDDKDLQDEENMKNKASNNDAAKVEEQIRKAVRRALSEAKPDPWKNAPPVTGPLPPVKKIPAGVHGGEYTRRLEKNKSDVEKYLGKNAPEIPDPVTSDDSDLPDDTVSDDLGLEPADQTSEPAPASVPDVPKPQRTRKATALGSMADVSGASFEDIAKELGFSIAGAKQAVDKALEKAQFLATGIEEDDREILVLNALNDYVKYLSKSGELTPADVQLMKQHPDIVRELDGFRDFLHNSIRRARKQGQRVMNPLDDDSGVDDTVDVDDDTDVDLGASDVSPAAPPPPPAAGPAAGRSAKTSYKIYPGSRNKWGGKPVVTRVKGQVYGPSGETQFSPNEQGEMLVGPDGKLSVKKPGSDHTQTWDPVDEGRLTKHQALVREALKKLL